MKKKLDNPQLINELKGRSAFFTHQGVKSNQIENAPLTSHGRQEPENRSDTPHHRMAQPNGRTARPKQRTGQIPHRTEKPNGMVPPTGSIWPVLQFMADLAAGGSLQNHKRVTKRFSFEIYVDQVNLIEEIRYLYQRQAGSKIAVSQILRDVIDAALPQIKRRLSDSASLAQDNLIPPSTDQKEESTLLTMPTDDRTQESGEPSSE